MLQKKNSKERLFEVMRRVAPDFKGEILNENVKPAQDKKPLKEGDDKWIQGAVNPEHKGFCTPMSKETCTAPKKALAKRFKSGDLSEAFGAEEIGNEVSPEGSAEVPEIGGSEMGGGVPAIGGGEEQELSVEEKYQKALELVDQLYAILHDEGGEASGEELGGEESPEHEAGETPEEEKAEHEPGGEEFGVEEPEEKPEGLQESKKRILTKQIIIAKK